MNKLILTTAALALTAGMSFADTVRMRLRCPYGQRRAHQQVQRQQSMQVPQ